MCWQVNGIWSLERSPQTVHGCSGSGGRVDSLSLDDGAPAALAVAAVCAGTAAGAPNAASKADYDLEGGSIAVGTPGDGLERARTRANNGRKRSVGLLRCGRDFLEDAEKLSARDIPQEALGLGEGLDGGVPLAGGEVVDGCADAREDVGDCVGLCRGGGVFEEGKGGKILHPYVSTRAVGGVVGCRFPLVELPREDGEEVVPEHDLC